MGKQFVYFALESKAPTALLAIKMKMAVGWCVGRGVTLQLATGSLCYISQVASFSKQPEIH